LKPGSQIDLISYLTDLQRRAGFDLVYVCKLNDAVASYPEGLFPDNICLLAEPNGYQDIESDKGAQAWLLASHLISDDKIQSQNLIVGVILDHFFTQKMLVKTCFEHTIYFETQPVARSLSFDPKSLSPISKKEINSDPNNGGLKNEIRFKDQPNFANRFILSEIGLEAEVALAVGAIQAMRLKLLGILVASMIIAIIIASVLGAFLARQISQPLVCLVDSAARLSSGDLNKSTVVETQVREILQVSKALEDARHDLQRTINSLRKEIEWGDLLLDSIVEGIVTLVDQNQITFFSSGAERITGRYRDEILNSNVDDVFKFTELNTPFSQHIPSPDQKKFLTL
jgi:PAS domain-containing protein